MADRPTTVKRLVPSTAATGWPPEDIAERESIAIEAVCEIDALVGALVRNEGKDGDDLVRRGGFCRIRDLSSVVMSHLNAQSDAGRETQEMSEVVYGPRYMTEGGDD